MASAQQFSGKVSLVTGAGSGIGEACARELAARRSRVVVADLNLSAAERVAEGIRGSGGEAAAVQADVGDPASVERIVRTTLDRYTRLDIAVNNAGIGGESNPVGEYSLDSWHRVIAINLNGVFYCMRSEIPAMLRSGGGAIINMASILGSVGFANSSAYVAAKHGVVGLTKSAAIEYATRGIRITSVGPGFITTPLVASNLDEPSQRTISEMHAMKRMGTAQEVAALVWFLASDEASFITGSYHVVDGGYTAS